MKKLITYVRCFPKDLHFAIMSSEILRYIENETDASLSNKTRCSRPFPRGSHVRVRRRKAIGLTVSGLIYIDMSWSWPCP